VAASSLVAKRIRGNKDRGALETLELSTLGSLEWRQGAFLYLVPKAALMTLAALRGVSYHDVNLIPLRSTSAKLATACRKRMEQIRRITLFEQEAARFLPGVLYSFNIADLKRRNCHFGYRVGDADIAEFDGLIAATAQLDGTAQRVGGDRWLMLSRANAADRIEALLAAYLKAEPLDSGWRIRASRDGEERLAKAPLPTVIRRAVRCLYTGVANQTELAPAIAALEENNWGIPVNRPYPLSQLAALPRERWRCVDQYPEQDPACPFCGGLQFAWTDGDDCSSDGTCLGCGAEISVHM
jgi:GGDEF domain-containing protein